MADLASFLGMGGYAGFVWTSYGLVALVMAAIFVSSYRELRRRERELKALQALAPHRRRARKESA